MAWRADLVSTVRERGVGSEEFFLKSEGILCQISWEKSNAALQLQLEGYVADVCKDVATGERDR